MIFRFIFLLFLFLFFQSCNKENKELKDNDNTLSEIKDFLFVGMINTKPGIYKYDFEDNNYQQLWFDKKEKVIELSYSEKRKNAFFITAKNFGLSGAFPYINNIKMYVINPETGEAGLVEEIEDGLQVFTHWEDENNFRVIINSFDKTNANYVNHRILLFNIFGRKLIDRTEIFDITKQGYPQLPEKEINYTSPGKEFSLETKGTDSVSIYLKKNNSQRFIVRINQQIKQIEWIENLVFFSSINILPDNESLYSENPETSGLFIFSLERNKIVNSWEGGGIKNFFILNNFIIFDTGFDENSGIIIYDFLNRKVMNEIKINGGCGLRNIPKIPDYGV